MANWRLRVELADVFKRADDDVYEEHVVEIVQEIERRLKASGWLEMFSGDLDAELHREQLELLFEELGEAKTYDEFNKAWQYLYDEADGDRVWIEIFREPAS